MRKTTKVWLFIAAFLVLAGCMLFAGIMSQLNWDFTKLSTVRYETNTYEISEVFDSITVDTDTANIVFALSDDGKCKVVCYEEEKEKHSVAVKDGALTVEVMDGRSFLDHIGIYFSAPKITVYLPETEYKTLLIHGSTGAVEVPADLTFRDISITLSTGRVDLRASAAGKIQIRTSTGAICVEGISAGELALSASTGKVNVSGVTCKGDISVEVSTGKVHLADILCKNVISSGDTGDVSLVDVIASEMFSIRTDTGDIRFDRSDAAEIFVETDTGDVTGTLLTDKVFLAQTDTGSVDVPKTATGGRCQIITDTGDIKITVE